MEPGTEEMTVGLRRKNEENDIESYRTNGAIDGKLLG